MGTKDVKPTRSELIELKKKIKLSQSGHKLLKMKRDGLILEFFEILNKAKGVRNELDDAYDKATEKIGIAEAVEGRMVIKSTALALKDGPEISLESHNIMGVVVPKIEASSVHKPINKRGYGILGTSSYIDETVDSYEILVNKIILAAEIETTMKRLLEDIEKTKRRVNALNSR